MTLSCPLFCVAYKAGGEILGSPIFSVSLQQQKGSVA